MLPTLRLHDGYALPPYQDEGGTPELMPVVERLQRALDRADLKVDIDGLFGPGTRRAVLEWQSDNGLEADGVVGPLTWKSLRPHIRPTELGIAPTSNDHGQLTGFHGDLGFIHEKEGHRGKPYWPGGASGVTLDPGVDLAHQSASYIESLYSDCTTPTQMRALVSVLGRSGRSARNALRANGSIQEIRISRQKALQLMPVVAKKYWEGICERFPTLCEEETPGSVQTALLSLSYNRGYRNRGLDPLGPSIDAGAWQAVADTIGAMQQDHSLRGIRRRRREEAELIRDELDGLDNFTDSVPVAAS